MGFDLNRETHVTLVAMDIVGFSRNIASAEGLCQDRSNLFSAVKNTALFPRALSSDSVRVHFLGDELRLAFLQTAATKAEIAEFVEEVNTSLDKLPAEIRTVVRSVALVGSLKVREVRQCKYLHGELPLEAQKWLGDVKPGHFATMWKTADSHRASNISAEAWMKQLSVATPSLDMPLSSEAGGGKPHFVLALATELVAHATTPERLEAFERLVTLVEQLLSKTDRDGSTIMVSVAPGGMMLAVESDTFELSRRLLEDLRTDCDRWGLSVAAALTTGALVPVHAPWLSDNFEGSAAIVAARLLSRLGPNELAVAPNIVRFWKAAENFQARTMSGKRRERFVARVHGSWFAPSAKATTSVSKEHPPAPSTRREGKGRQKPITMEPKPRSSPPGRNQREQLVDLVRSHYLSTSYRRSGTPSKTEMAFSEVLGHIADLRVPMTSTSNTIADLCNWILERESGVELRVEGAAGTGKTTLLALLYWHLLAESQQRPNLLVHYIDAHYFSRSTYESEGRFHEHQSVALCREHLAPLTELLKESPGCMLVLIVDGVDPSAPIGYADSIQREIRSSMAHAKYQHLIGMRVLEPHESSSPSSAIARSREADIVLRRMPIHDERLSSFVNSYLKFKNHRATPEETKLFIDSIRQIKVREVDMFTLRTLIRVLEDPSHAQSGRRLTFAGAMTSYCKEFLGSDDPNGLEKAARLVFDREVMQADIAPQDIRGGQEWDLSRIHPIVKWFLISYYVMESFTAWGRQLSENREIDPGPGPHQFPYPYEVNRFCRELLNDEGRTPKVILACKHLVETGTVPDRIHAAYLLGRIEERNLRQEATTILLSLLSRLESDERTSGELASPTDQKARQQYILLRRTVSISLIQLAQGRSPHLDSYLEELMRSPEWDSVNRGFHLEYYGDLEYLPAAAFIHDDTLEPCNRTVEQLESRLSLGPSQNPLFELELHTLCSLVQHRLAAGKEDAERLVARLRPLIRRYADDVQNDLLKGYLALLSEHLDVAGTPQGRIIEQIYRLKVLRRSGWVERGLHTAPENTVVESVADHTLGAYMLGSFFLPERCDETPEYDKPTILKMILFHDIGEAITGDLLPHERTGEKAELERQAVRYFSLAGTYANMGETAPVLGLWEAFEHESDTNAKVAGDLDKLDIVVQTYLYENEHRPLRDGGGTFEEFRSSVAKNLKTSHGRRILAIVRQHFER